jgi:predicted metal-binding membrane protein
MSETQGSSDWVTAAVDTVERYVSLVRDNATSKLVTVLRFVIYGVIAVVIGLMLAVLFLIGLVRAVNVALPGDVWAAHLLIGAVLTVVGLFVWSRRTAKEADA